MKSDIIVIGGGASGLVAAYSAATHLVASGDPSQVTVLERMPRPARKTMITGKGRCNFTNVKPWNDFSAHVRSNPNLVKSAFYNLPPEAMIEFIEGLGTPTVVERGDRAFPSSHRASDIVDALVRACLGAGVKIQTECEVSDVCALDDGFALTVADGSRWTCRKLIVATGGLSYPGTGSTGDGFRWAGAMGHRIEPLFPSLTALVPRGYKDMAAAPAGTDEAAVSGPSMKGHIAREVPRTELGDKLCGIQLKNVGVQLLVEGSVAASEFGDLDFTDGGIEGPIGFQVSRKAVKSIVNGSRVALVLDLKPGVDLTEVTLRVKALWQEIADDPRSRRLREKERCRILLGKLMPWELIPAFMAMNPEIMTLERRSRTETKLWVNLVSIAKALKAWRFDIDGFVGWERAVVTAGGVGASEVVAKTLESRRVPGLYFCGEVLDVDCDTGGYNLQVAFCTGALAGRSAAVSIL